MKVARLVALAVLGSLLAPASVASAQDKDTCVASYADNQRLRKQGKLRSAREALLVCASTSCPEFIQSDCATWLSELDAQLPSVVIAATGPDGRDTAAVEVREGGVVLAASLDGRPIPLDPGPHELDLVHAGAGVQRRSILLREGEKGRRIEVSFAPDAVAPPPAPRPSGEAKPRALGLAGIFIGIGGLTALGVFTGYAVAGSAEFDELDRSCGSLAPPPATGTCSDEQIADVKQTLTIADAFLGIGAGLALVGATLTIIDFATAPREPAKVALRVGATGAALRVEF